VRLTAFAADSGVGKRKRKMMVAISLWLAGPVSFIVGLTVAMTVYDIR
jgi:hypothetical protein